MKRIAFRFLFSFLAAESAMADQLLGPRVNMEAETDRYQKSQFEFFGMLGSQNNKLTDGGGTSVNMNNSQSTTNGVSYKRYDKSGWGLFAGFERKEVPIKSPSGITPATVTYDEKVYHLAALTKPLKDTAGWFSNSELGIGFWLLDRNGERSSPSDLVSNESKSGLSFRAHVLREFNESFNYSVGSELFIVNAFKESSSTTGYYNLGYVFKFRSLLVYPTSKYVDLSLGLELFYESTSFYGTGTRGLTDAQELAFGFGIPLKITIFF